MSRTTHIVVQFSLLVVWALVLISDSTITASCQTCTQPPYFWTNPIRNYWNPNVGNITVKLDSRFATHSPQVPDAAARLESGTRQWNNLDICAPTLNFSNFASKTFTQTEYQSNPPQSHVYFFVAHVDGSFAEEQSVNSENFCIAAIIRIRPDSPVVAANASEFNFTASHEIGHSFNLRNCTAQCHSVSVMGGVLRDGPGSCDIEKVRALYCPTPTPTPTLAPEQIEDQGECTSYGYFWNSFASPPCRSGSIGPACSPEQWGFWHHCYECQYWCSGCDCLTDTPVLVDVLGNDFNLTNLSGGVMFDLNADGTPERHSWTATNSDDMFLVLDRNANGTIDDGTELFGNHTPQPASDTPNGFSALAEYDRTANGGNGDGVITAADSIFSRLRLWQDRNHDGFSQPDELYRLSSFGLETLEFDYKESKRSDQFGNGFRYRAKVKVTNKAHTGRWAWDVFLLSAP